ncbi:ATP-binding protein [Sulfolobus tengchongensis]|uniref:ATP-binding protein n=1 Tax=Sulfolobus tengchongensis TaxID=207809 RepID=A0AAX4L0A8_9CREN
MQSTLGGKVIFTKRPRYDIEEIFDREEEIKQLIFLLKNNEWTIILGPRMSGKTSLALAVSNSIPNKRVVYVDLVKVKGLKDFVNRLYFSIPKTLTEKVKESLDVIGVRVGPTTLSFKLRSTSVIETIIKSICQDTILILDEAQDLKEGINHLVPVLHRLLNTCPSLSVIFTGSAIGLIKTLLEQKGEQPLAGRKPTEILLKPWSEETAIEYLEEGLQNCKVKYTKEEIREVINELGTLVGWLNIYGVNRCVKKHEDALKYAIEEAIGIAMEEINNIIEDQAWRRKAIKLLAIGSTWSILEDNLKVSTETLSKFLDRLERLYVVQKIGRTYVISDPVYRKASLRA